ncbi:hypothetical protein ABTY96_34895 [Streptomyces sp. NPDC096057]|uniref:hypothetical protein n=1 Tax=Streptomyces sp. NPDC096057 TaxID=3155543 RepID=UPI0033288EA2
MADWAARVDALMAGSRGDLVRPAAIPSVAFPGFPGVPVIEAHDLRVLFAELGSTVVAMGAFVEEYAADFRSRGGTATAL